MSPVFTSRAFRTRAFVVLLGAILILAMQAGPVRSQVSVLTQNNDNARTGANRQETILTPFNVNSTRFGKLFTLNLDANVNGQVLYVPQLTIKGAVHNTLFAYTSNNTDQSPSSLYAFDADDGTPLWHATLPNSATYTTPTPVIDPTTDTMYVLTKTNNDDTGATYLHAINILTGQDKTGSPVQVQASAPGIGDGNVNGVVSFDGPSNGQRFHANDRPGLLLLNGVVYAAFAHNTDSTPYHGWVLGYHYDGTKFTQTAKFCTTPNGGDGGIWMAGKGLTADANGYIYCTVGNGTFDIPSGGKDYGMCVLKLRASDLTVTDWFAPFDEQGLSNQDEDFGNCGILLIPGTNRLFTGATKFGSAFLLDSTTLGGFTVNGPDNVLDRINSVSSNDNVGQNPIAWDAGNDKYVYLWPKGETVRQFRYDPGSGNLNPGGVYQTGSDSATSGGSLAVSSNGKVNGILWTVGRDAVVRAYRADDVSQDDIWDSSQNSARDALGSVGHFEFPTVVNGKVYVPTGSHSIAVYGLLPSAQQTAVHLLWNNTNGKASLWTQPTAGGTFSSAVYGPYSGWTARATADGPDGNTQMLWTNTNGQMALWNVTPSGRTTSAAYGPYSGWTARSLSVGPDNTVHVLWTRADGTASLWRVSSPANFTDVEFGPYADWSAQAIADGPDNKTRILWARTNGQISLWHLDNSTNQNQPVDYGPYSGWTAITPAVGPDNQTRILWKNGAGQISLWLIDLQNNFTDQEYGPYSGWSAVSVAVGSDNLNRILWDKSGGTISLWALPNGGNFTSKDYGPYSGWTGVGVSASQ